MLRRDFLRRAGLWVPAVGLLVPQLLRAEVSYFGITTPTGDQIRALEGQTAYLEPYSTVSTCPGTGKQSVKALDAYVIYLGSPANIRLSLYAADGTFICQGASQVSVTAAAWDFAWFGHTSFVDAAGTSIPDPQIDGGSDYKLAVSADGPIYLWRIATGGNGGFIKSLDSTPGFPSPLGTGYTEMVNDNYLLRCGVEPTGGGGETRKRQVVIV